MESNSPVCDHLRESGYFSCFEVSSPSNISNSSLENISIHRIGSPRDESDNENTSGDIATTNNANCNDPPFPFLTTSMTSTTPYPSMSFESINSEGLTHSSRFVSHRTHNNEDLGVDHIFIKPEISETVIENGSTGSSLVAAANSKIDEKEKEIEIDSRSFEVLVSDSVVYPGDVSASTWFEGFSPISDHRPVGANIIFGKRIR